MLKVNSIKLIYERTHLHRAFDTGLDLPQLLDLLLHLFGLFLDVVDVDGELVNVLESHLQQLVVRMFDTGVFEQILPGLIQLK